ncbi:MAG: hypothetical protein KDH48_18565, partial [Rhodoferax sp.]|nr:hypothetical protein [Rhodoferax sp.]
MSQKSPSNGASGAAQHQGASAPLIRIEDVDVVFSRSPKPALDLLDQGLSRDAIFKQTGLI